MNRLHINKNRFSDNFCKISNKFGLKTIGQVKLFLDKEFKNIKCCCVRIGLGGGLQIRLCWFESNRQLEKKKINNNMNEIVTFDNGNTLHIIKRKINKNMFINMEDVKVYRDFLCCDTVKQDNESYYFLVDIDDVEFEMIDDTL